MTSPAQTHGQSNLRRLLIIRSIVLGLQALTLYGLAQLDASALAFGPLSALLGLYTLLAAATAWRLRRPWPVADGELLAQLLADVLLLSLLLYWSGGSTNPFVSYYLVPLSISAAVLPHRHTASLMALCVGAYTLMLFHYQPVSWLAPAHDHHAGHGGAVINAHILGMWASFAMSAVLITAFVGRMAGALRQRDAQLSRERERRLREEQLLALGALAAGTAHELGTPLAGAYVLADDLRAALAGSEHGEDARLLQQQLQACRDILRNLAQSAEPLRRGQRRRVDAAAAMTEILDHWQLLRPDAQAALRVHASGEVEVDATLEQALVNLLNNAQEASAAPIEVEVETTAGGVLIRILDRGPGLAAELAAGTPFLSTKGEGRGLGLFLANASIERLGGSVRQLPRSGGGTRTEVTLPRAEERNP